RDDAEHGQHQDHEERDLVPLDMELLQHLRVLDGGYSGWVGDNSRTHDDVAIPRHGRGQRVVLVERDGEQVDDGVEDQQDDDPHEHVGAHRQGVPPRPEWARGQAVQVREGSDAADRQPEGAQEPLPATRYHEHAVANDGLRRGGQKEVDPADDDERDSDHAEVVKALTVPHVLDSSFSAPVTLKFMRLTESVITKMISEMAEPKPYA